MKVESISACPICGGSCHTLIGEKPDELILELARFVPHMDAELLSVTNRLVRCQGCGLGYLNPRLASLTLTRVYDLWYRYGYPRFWGTPEGVAQRRHEFRKYHLHLVKRAAAAGASLLDVGCGTGEFVDVAREAGYQAVGVDFDAAAIAIARQNFGGDIRHGRLAQAVAPDERFDLITMFDFLEHSEYPNTDLKEAVARLKAGGALVVRVPNAGSLQARWMGMNWLGIISNHLQYFDHSSLSTALTAHGLVIEHSFAGNFASLGSIMAQRWRWLRQRCARSGYNEPTPIVTSAKSYSGGLTQSLIRLANSLLIEQIDHVGGWFGAGNNLVLIARKPCS